VAHILVWMWRPWLPGPEGYTSLNDSIMPVLSLLT
jgi:light-harvesting complex 1 beta chain